MTILRIIDILIEGMEITLKLSDLVIMQSNHKIFYIFHLKILATGFPVAKTLIKYIAID